MAASLELTMAPFRDRTLAQGVAVFHVEARSSWSLEASVGVIAQEWMGFVSCCTTTRSSEDECGKSRTRQRLKAIERPRDERRAASGLARLAEQNGYRY
jgi:hypothetical protein